MEDFSFSYALMFIHLKTVCVRTEITSVHLILDLFKCCIGMDI